jgi:hypothetical protein
MIGTQTISTGFVFLLAIRHAEGVSTFALASVGGALAAGAVGEADVSLLLYPVYYCLANVAMALLIHRRRAALLAMSPRRPAYPSRGSTKGRPCPTPHAALGLPGPSQDGSRA